MTIIAMTREIGTCGSLVAEQLAERLGLTLVGDEFLQCRIADRRELPGCDPSGMPPRRAANLKALVVQHHRRDRAAAEEIYELAAYGNVLIRGWKAVSLLQSRSDVFRVRICASMSFRIAVLAARTAGVREADLRRRIEQSDAREGNNQRWIDADGAMEPSLFHLVLNTELMPVAACVAQLALLVRGATSNWAPDKVRPAPRREAPAELVRPTSDID